MQTIYFNGKLSLSDTPSDKNRSNYIVTDLSTQEQKSITDVLDTIYKSTVCNKLVRIALRIFDNNHIINKMGSLMIARDKFHVESYHINSLPFCLQLDELCGRNIELVLEDYTDSTSDSEVQVHVS